MSSVTLAKEEAIHLKFQMDCHGRPAEAGLPRNDKEGCDEPCLIGND